MEVVGAIASFIAIGQALEALPKIINTLKPLFTARKEVLQLRNEVELLNSLGNFVRVTIQHLPRDELNARLETLEYTLLQRVEADTASIISQLGDFCRQLQKGTKKNGKIKVDRIKWVWYKGEIAQLSKRARENREDLRVILSCVNMLAATSQGKMIMDIHAIVTTQVHPGTPLPPLLQPTSQTGQVDGSVSRVVRVVDDEDYETAEEGSDTETETDDAMPAARDNRRQITPSTVSGEYSSLLMPGPLPLAQAKSIASRPGEEATQDNEPLLQVTATLRRTCPRKCKCQCHSPPARTQSHPTTSFIYGWLNSAYNSVPGLGTRRCDEPTCQRSRSPVHVHFRVPLFLCSRTLEATMSFSGVVGAGASLHLRVPRIHPDRITIFSEIEAGKVEKLRRDLALGRFSPLDEDSWSETIIESSLIIGQYKVTLILLQECMSVLRGTDIARRMAEVARSHLHYPSLGCYEKSILRKVITLYDNDDSTDTPWPIHDAVRNRRDLAAALDDFPGDIDALDDTGYSPLHLAVHNGDEAVTKALLSRGANPDVADRRGRTPLMRACIRGNYLGAHILIDSGCDINSVDSRGLAALQYTVKSHRRNSVGIVDVLLRNGARLIRDVLGRTPLHFLALHPNAAGIAEKFRLLVLAGEDLGARDHSYSHTVLTKALIRSNHVLVRLLLSAGCKFNDSADGTDILLRIAYDSNAETMRVVNEARYTTDVRVRVRNGETALGRFEWRLRADHRFTPGSFRAPDESDIEAFRELLRGVRDRYLTAEIQTLEDVITHIKAEETSLAQETLQPIIQEKIRFNIPAELRTFRAINVQIREGMVGAAIESLEEFIEVSRARIGTDPFKGNYCRKSGLRNPGLIVKDEN